MPPKVWFCASRLVSRGRSRKHGETSRCKQIRSFQICLHRNALMNCEWTYLTTHQSLEETVTKNWGRNFRSILVSSKCDSLIKHGTEYIFFVVHFVYSMTDTFIEIYMPSTCRIEVSSKSTIHTCKFVHNNLCRAVFERVLL